MGRFDSMVSALVDRGWFVGDDLLPKETVSALGVEARRLFAEGWFRPAGVGRDRGHALRPEIRGDSILWIDEGHASAAISACRATLDELRMTLNRELFLGLESFEMHFARYPVGARYDRHLDRFYDQAARTISCILYLNESWEPDHGGQLRLWLENGAHDVPPAAGTWVIFRSELIEHEVRPANRERDSLTGWFRRR
jgi:SM-20-related protein